MGWLRKVFDWNREGQTANAATTESSPSPPSSLTETTPQERRPRESSAAQGVAWWESADLLIDVADRAIEISSPADAELARRVSERLNAGQYQLPVLPVTLVRVLELGSKSETTPREVADCIQSDAAVAGEVLSLVNSPAYLPASPIKDLHRAVVHVGVRRVQGLMLGVAARLTVVRSAEAGRAHPLWSHSLGTALLAREIARAAASDPEEAFVAGLLHDIGKTVILGVVAEEERAHKGTRMPEALVDKLLDECHTGAGSRIARSWKLPEPFCRVIEEHHGLRPSSTALVAVVALANDVCGQLGIGVPCRRADLGNHRAFPILGFDAATARHLIARLPDVLEENGTFGGLTRFGRGRGGKSAPDRPVQGGGPAALASR